MEEMEQVLSNIEYMFLKCLVKGLRDKSMKAYDAKMFAQAFLKMKPFTSIEDIKAKMRTFSAEHVQFKGLDEYMNAYEEEKKTGEVIEKMKKYIKNDDIDKALEVAQRPQ